MWRKVRSDSPGTEERISEREAPSASIARTSGGGPSVAARREAHIEPFDHPDRRSPE